MEVLPVVNYQDKNAIALMVVFSIASKVIGKMSVVFYSSDLHCPREAILVAVVAQHHSRA